MYVLIQIYFKIKKVFKINHMNENKENTPFEHNEAKKVENTVGEAT